MIKANRYYLRACRPIATSWETYGAGELIRASKNNPRSFMKIETAIDYRRLLGFTDAAVKVCSGLQLMEETNGSE